MNVIYSIPIMLIVTDIAIVVVELPKYAFAL